MHMCWESLRWRLAAHLGSLYRSLEKALLISMVASPRNQTQPK